MAAGGMAEEIEDAFFLHQARDEIEIRFAILNAVLPLGIGIVQLPGDIEALQDLLQDIGHLQVLKDAQISLARQHPDLGRDGGAVAGEAEGSGQLCEGGHNAVDVSGFAARRPDYPEGDRLTQDVLEFDPGVFGPQLELEPKELRDGLLPRERLEQEFIRTQARLDVKETILFQITVCHLRPPSASMWRRLSVFRLRTLAETFCRPRTMRPQEWGRGRLRVCATLHEYTKFPSAPIATRMDSSFCPSAMRVSNWREISGSNVLVRMLSTLRAPLSTSVQRRAISSMSALSHTRWILWFSWMRF